jgi:hypothetical protein
MLPSDKLNAVCALASLGSQYEEIASDMLTQIDRLVSPTPPPNARAPQPLSPTLDEMVFTRKAGKLQGVKAYRTRTGLGLKESKEAIEKGMDYLGWPYGPFHPNNESPSFLFEDIEPLPF